jgi:RND family efflux transporter MFP subunit
MKKKIIIPAVAAVLITATAFKLLSNKKEVESNIYHVDPEKKVLVQADTVYVQRLRRDFTYTGTFIPVREVMIIPQVHGEVTEVYFHEGQKVRQGERLLQIDDELLQAQLISIEANFETAKRNLERYEKASVSGGVSPMQLDNYRVNFKNAESQLKQVTKQIQLSSIEAPFAGTITFKDVEPGTIAGASPVARITDISKLKLEISVPETEINIFKRGSFISIQTDAYAGKKFDGLVDYVSERADGAHNYTVKIVVRNDEAATPVKAGMYGKATVNNAAGQESITIPRSGLLGSAKNPQVFVIKGNEAVLTSIETGSTNGEAIEVLRGLYPGDVVVTGGQINLTTGSKVDIAK